MPNIRYMNKVNIIYQTVLIRKERVIMATFEGTIYSDALRMMTSITVSIPQVVEGDMPVLYLLHGLSDNHSAWLRRSNVDLYAEKSGFAVVMPEVQRSFYTDMAYGLRYFTYICGCKLFRRATYKEKL